MAKLEWGTGNWKRLMSLECAVVIEAVLCLIMQALLWPSQTDSIYRYMLKSCIETTDAFGSTQIGLKLNEIKVFSQP